MYFSECKFEVADQPPRLELVDVLLLMLLCDTVMDLRFPPNSNDILHVNVEIRCGLGLGAGGTIVNCDSLGFAS